MSKPRLTQVLWSLERAGAERVVFDLVSCLRDRYDIRVVAAGGGGSMIKEFQALGVELSIGPKTKNRWETFSFLWRELRDHRPDVLHTHLGGDVWAGLVAVLKRLHPWISTAHNTDQDDPVRRHVLRSLAARRADHTACVSHAVKLYTHQEFKVPLHRLSVIANGIDLSTIEVRPPRPFSDIPVIFMVGRLTAQKGQATLLQALSKIKRPWKLEIYGEGPDRMLLERLTESLGLLPRVTFHGVVSDLRRRLAEADLVCFPSRWEGQGIAILEAAASAVPMIVSDIPVSHEWFDQTSARFAPADQSEVWTKVIQEVLDQPSPAIQRAAEARKIVLARGTREQMAEQYHQLYQRWLQTYAHSSR